MIIMASHSRRSSPTFFFIQFEPGLWRPMASDSSSMFRIHGWRRAASQVERWTLLSCAGCHGLPSRAMSHRHVDLWNLNKNIELGAQIQSDSQHLNSWWVNYRMNQVGYDQVNIKSHQVKCLVSMCHRCQSWWAGLVLGARFSLPSGTLKGQIYILAVASGWNEGGAPQRAATVSWFITALTMVYGTYMSYM